MAHIIAQETGQGQFYVTALNYRSELVLGSTERKDAKRFESEKDAQDALDRTPSPTENARVVELIGPDGPYRPTSPLGYVLQVCENKRIESLGQLRSALPKDVFQSLDDEGLWALVARQTELLLEWPWTVDLLLMIRHTETEHRKSGMSRNRHAHAAERDPETREVIRPRKENKHSHDDDLDRLRKEVREMATATKSKPKAKAREKKEKVLHDCHCGCGGTTFANFQPGHDARIYGILRKISKGDKDAKLPKVLTDNKELCAAMREKAH